MRKWEHEKARAVNEQVALLAHHDGDDVAVAVLDVEPSEAVVAFLDTGRRLKLEVTEDVPFGHKAALRDLGEGADIIEYGTRVALARCPIGAGALVHTHNVRSVRWQASS